jgi:hypothetical protein
VHYACLKWQSRFGTSKEQEKIIFDKISYPLVITARMLALITLGLIPLTLYLSFKNGLQAFKHKNLTDAIRAIRDISGSIGFGIPLSRILLTATSQNISEKLQESPPLLDNYRDFLTDIFTKYTLKTEIHLPRINCALGFPSNYAKYDKIGEALASRGLRNMDDLETNGIVLDTRKDASINFGERLVRRLVNYLEDQNKTPVKLSLLFVRRVFQLFQSPRDVMCGIIFYIFLERVLNHSGIAPLANPKLSSHAPAQDVLHHLIFQAFYSFTVDKIFNDPPPFTTFWFLIVSMWFQEIISHSCGYLCQNFTDQSRSMSELAYISQQICLEACNILALPKNILISIFVGRNIAQELLYYARH